MDVQLETRISAKQVVDSIVEIVCACFDDRILSIYLTGSFSREQLTAYSDIDMLIVFRASFEPGEYKQFMQLRQGIQRLSPFRLDVWAESESKLKTRPASEALRAAKCLYGEDFIHSVPIQSIDYFAMQSIHKSIHYMTVLRGRPEQNIFPLHYPDSDDRYYGYTTYGDFDGEAAFKPGTRIIVDMITRCTTAILALETGLEAHTKQDSIDLCATHIGGKWADFVKNIFDLIRNTLHYRLPDNIDEQTALQTLLSQLIDFENDALAKFKPAILKNLTSDNRRQRKLAVVALKNIQFQDEAILEAVNTLSDFDDSTLLETVKSKLINA